MADGSLTCETGKWYAGAWKLAADTLTQGTWVIITLMSDVLVTGVLTSSTLMIYFGYLGLVYFGYIGDMYVTLTTLLAPSLL